MHDRVLTNFAKWNSPSFPGFPEPINTLFHPVKKLKPDVMYHLSSHFGTVQTDVRWCRRSDRHCRLFIWSICISWNHSQIFQCQSVLFCGCILLFRRCFTRSHQPYDKFPRVYLKIPDCYLSCKHPALVEQCKLNCET